MPELTSRMPGWRSTDPQPGDLDRGVEVKVNKCGEVRMRTRSEVEDSPPASDPDR